MTYIPEFRAQFAITSLLDDFSVGASILSLTTGSYYLAGETSATTDLLPHLQAVIRASGASQDSTNVSYLSNGSVSINLETAATVTFNDSGLASILGFSSASQASALIHVSDRTSRYCWRPTRRPTSVAFDLNTLWETESTPVCSWGTDGTSYSVQGKKRYRTEIEFGLLPESVCITPSTGTRYQDFQQFYEDVVHVGKPLRYYPDRDVNFYHVCMIGNPTEEVVPTARDIIERHVTSYNGLWNLRIPMYKKV
jgi:hypothetical protein